VRTRESSESPWLLVFAQKAVEMLRRFPAAADADSYPLDFNADDFTTFLNENGAHHLVGYHLVG